MPNPIVTYADVCRLMLRTLQTSHPEWSEATFSAYDARIAAVLKRLERRQPIAVTCGEPPSSDSRL